MIWTVVEFRRFNIWMNLMIPGGQCGFFAF